MAEDSKQIATLLRDYAAHCINTDQLQVAALVEGAADEIERLTEVAVSAKRLVQTAHDYIDHDETTVEEPALTALESALEAAGYDMTDQEFCRDV